MLGWQRPARRSGRLSDSRVFRTHGTKERSSKAVYLAKTPTRWDRLLQVIHEEAWNDRQRSLPVGRVRADSRAQILKEAGLFEGGPETRAWLQDTELINDDTISVAKQTTIKLEKLNYNMSRDYESYYSNMTKYQPKQINLLPNEQNRINYTCTKNAAYSV